MKKLTWKLSAALSAGLALLVAGSTHADDSAPPCWRGNPGTTSQNWSFAVSNNPAAPESFTNPNGTPQATFSPGSFATGWKASSLGRTGLWDLGKAGQVSLAVRGFGGPANSWEYLQVQVTYFDAPGFYVAPATTIAGATLVSSQTISNQAFGPGVWRTQTTLWLVQPAPALTTVLVSGDPNYGLALDQVIVDTRSPAVGAGEVAGYRPCWRGRPGATFAQWMFGVPTSPSAMAPEFATNSYGSPSATLVAGPFSAGYIEEDPFLGCRQGIWDLGENGTLSLGIPNNPSASASSWKYLTVEVTQYRDGLYNANATVSLAGATLLSQHQQTVETTSYGGTWVVEQTVWKLAPSPSAETVVLTAGHNGSLIDQVVVDTLELDFTCPQDLVASADPGQCSKAGVTWSVPAVDGCVVTNVVSVPANGSSFNVGTNPVSVLIQDALGGSKSCSFQVAILDTQPPTVSCPADIVVAKDPSQCGAVVSFTPGAVDNCSVASVNSTPPSGSLFPLGLSTVTCTATDSSSNTSAPCTFTVRVVDLSGDVAAYRPCWRGQANSTFQQWAFSVSNNPAALTAELVTNSFGAPQASLVAGPFSAGYIEQDPFLGCRQGIWDLGENGTMSLSIPNTPSAPASSYKYVAVQVTQYRDGSLYTTNAWVAIAGATLVSRQQVTVETTTFGGQWIVEQTVWKLAPSPSAETVVLTAGDNGSLIDQVVVDTLELDFTCPQDIVANADLGQCSKAGVTWSVPTVDGCVVTNVVSVPANGSSFNVGTNPVSVLIQDALGGSKICSFQVAILDTQPPTVTCPADIVVAKDPSQCGAVVSFIPSALDNCSVASVSSMPPSGSLFPLGLSTVTCTATDSSSNTSSPCTFTVRVVDFSGDVAAYRPCWRGQANSTFQQWAFSVSNNPAALTAELVTNSFGTPQASLLAGPFSAGYIEQDPFLGCRQGIWDLGENGTMSLSVPNTSSAPASSYKYVAVQVTQYRDGSLYTTNAWVSIAGATLVSRQQVVVETTTFGGQWLVEQTVWKLAPSPSSETVVLTAGNNGSLIDQVVVDTLELDLPCPHDLVFSADAGLCAKTNVTWSVPAVDGCAVTNVVSVPANGSSFNVGTNPVSVLIQDGEGGFRSCSFQVVVTDDEAPVARCKDITVHLNGAGQATIAGADVDNGSTDNCGIDSLQVSPSSFTCANLGANPVVLTVTDVHGHVSTCQANVTVVDTTPPLIANCPADIVVGSSTNNPLSCSQTVSWVEPNASDNCSLASFTADHHPNELFDKGTTTVTYTAVDASNNTNTCSFTVTVVDDTPPSIACPGDMTLPSEAGVCGAMVGYPTPVGTDNCPGAQTTQISGLPSGSVFPAGSTTNTFRVVDAANHTNTCSFVVTVTARADLMVKTTASANPAALGTNLVYTVTVSNAGPCTAKSVVVSNILAGLQVGFAVTNRVTGVGQGCPFPGPVSWWQAEGNANDAVDGNSGVVAGGVSFPSGQVGQAFAFDGLTGSVTVPDKPSLRPASLTIEGWIKVQDVTGVHVVVGKRLGSGTADSYSMWIGSGVLFAAMADANGSGPFLTYPEFPTSSLFSAGDLVNFQAFALTLQAAPDPVSQFLKANLAPATLGLLSAYAGGPDPGLQSALLTDLNLIIQSGSIYTPARFSGVTLSQESSYILGRNPLGTDLVRLNRFLIRDAYPGDFLNTVFPQLNQYFHVAYSFDALTQVQALYVNGTLVNATFVPKTIDYDGHPLLIGADDNNGSPGFFYQGEIDELSIYDRALTGTEIRAIAQAGSGGKCPTPGAIALGDIASGATAQVSIVATPTNCTAVADLGSAYSSTPDPTLANNASLLVVPVLGLAPDQLRLSIQPVSVNNNLLRVSWPLSCGPFVFESTLDVNAPVLWSPDVVPVQLMGDLHSVIVPATNSMQYYRVRLP